MLAAVDALTILSSSANPPASPGFPIHGVVAALLSDGCGLKPESVNPTHLELFYRRGKREALA
jgi:hypothetical protein